MARTTLVLGVALALAAAPARAQADGAGLGADLSALGREVTGGRDVADVDEADLPLVEPPPPLTPSEVPKARRAIARLRNSHAERRAATEAEVIAFGRGVLPLLIDEASTDHEGKRAGLVACLLALADARDRDRVAPALESELVVLRRFAAIETGELGLARLLDALPPLLDDADPTVAMEAALSLTRRGREAGLGRLVDAYASDRRAEVLDALPGLAGRGPHRELSARLVIDPDLERKDPAAHARQRVTAVELLAAIGDDAAIDAIAQALDDPHNLVQRAAIDAVRALVERAPPLQAGSIFEQIREVERLKTVLARR